MIYITEKQALAAGMTHHGRIYGVPAWVCETADGVVGAPKLVPLVVWCWLVDWLYEAAAWLMPADRYIEAPLRVLRPIEGKQVDASRGR